MTRLRRWERRTRPRDPEFAAAPRRYEDFRALTPDAVWAETERGAGSRLDPHVFENGDVRCNRTAYGFVLGRRWFPLLDGDDPRDLAVRDAFFRHGAGIGFGGTPPLDLTVKLLRLVVRPPYLLGTAAGWLRRAVRRGGRSRSSCTRSWTPPRSHEHAVLDPAENAAPAVQLPMPTVRSHRNGAR